MPVIRLGASVMECSRMLWASSHCSLKRCPDPLGPSMASPCTPTPSLPGGHCGLLALFSTSLWPWRAGHRERGGDTVHLGSQITLSTAWPVTQGHSGHMERGVLLVLIQGEKNQEPPPHFSPCLLPGDRVSAPQGERGLAAQVAAEMDLLLMSNLSLIRRTNRVLPREGGAAGSSEVLGPTGQQQPCQGSQGSAWEAVWHHSPQCGLGLESLSPASSLLT
jgi:hypothetical protein